MTVLDLMRDPRLLGRHFAGGSWTAWEAFLAALYGLPLSAEGLAVYQAATGREAPSRGPVAEAFCVCGRRSGKSYVSALIAVYQAVRRYRVAPGERPVVLVCAVDRAQAKVVWSYALGLLEACPLTRREIVQRTAETVTLRSGVTIEIRSSSYRSVRGMTLAAAIIDECCFLRDEDSSAPDLELYRALKPGLSTTRGPLVCISSPWAQRGLMYQQWRKGWGREDGAALVWVAPSATMNPTLDAAMIAEALADDPVAARSEWLAAWREDVQPFLSDELVGAVIVPGRAELPAGGECYCGFLDASGGSQDSFTCAVAHREVRDGHPVVVLDALRERVPPFDPGEIVAEYAALLRSYGVRTAQADKYAGAWVVSAFAEHGVRVEQSAAPKSEIYAAFLPLVAGRRVELLDHGRLRAQLVSLERRTARSGRESIAEPPGGRDDLANACAGACLLAVVEAPTATPRLRIRTATVGPDGAFPALDDDFDFWRARRSRL